MPSEKGNWIDARTGGPALTDDGDGSVQWFANPEPDEAEESEHAIPVEQFQREAAAESTITRVPLGRPFDVCAEPIVEVNLEPDKDWPLVAVFWWKRPQLAHFRERERLSRVEYEEVNPQLERLDFEGEAGDVLLFDECVTAYATYKRKGPRSTPPAPKEITDAVRERFRPEVKQKAVAEMLRTHLTIERDELDESILFDSGEEWRIRQDFGGDPPAFSLVHVLRSPTPSERKAFRRKASDVFNVKGARKARSRIKTNIGASVEFYRALFLRAENALLDGQPYADALKAKYLDALGPWWMHVAAVRLVRAFESGQLD